MSYRVRRETVSFAQDLYNNILENMGHVEHYQDAAEYVRDLELFSILGVWLRQELLEEIENDSQMDE